MRHRWSIIEWPSGIMVCRTCGIKRSWAFPAKGVAVVRYEKRDGSVQEGRITSMPAPSCTKEAP